MELQVVRNMPERAHMHTGSQYINTHTFSLCTFLTSSLSVQELPLLDRMMSKDVQNDFDEGLVVPSLPSPVQTDTQPSVRTSPESSSGVRPGMSAIIYIGVMVLLAAALAALFLWDRRRQHAGNVVWAPGNGCHAHACLWFSCVNYRCNRNWTRASCL
jgi:hypothetical protein